MHFKQEIGDEVSKFEAIKRNTVLFMYYLSFIFSDGILYIGY